MPAKQQSAPKTPANAEAEWNPPAAEAETVQAPPEVPAAEAAPPVSHIVIASGYQGRPSREQWIAPGIYAVDDPRLLGLADYLLANGHAALTEA